MWGYPPYGPPPHGSVPPQGTQPPSVPGHPYSLSFPPHSALTCPCAAFVQYLRQAAQAAHGAIPLQSGQQPAALMHFPNAHMAHPSMGHHQMPHAPFAHPHFLPNPSKFAVSSAAGHVSTEAGAGKPVAAHNAPAAAKTELPVATNGIPAIPGHTPAHTALPQAVHHPAAPLPHPSMPPLAPVPILPNQALAGSTNIPASNTFCSTPRQMRLSCSPLNHPLQIPAYMHPHRTLFHHLLYPTYRVICKHRIFLHPLLVTPIHLLRPVMLDSRRNPGILCHANSTHFRPGQRSNSSWYFYSV